MRYTRYDYKKKGNGNFIFWLLATIILSVVLGMTFFNLFLKDGEESTEVNNKPVEKVQESDDSTNSNIKSFGIIQCGVYKNKENADSTIASIPNEYTSFLIEEGGNFKVFAGIFNLDEANQKTEALNPSVSSFRVRCDIAEDTDCNKAKAEIIDAYIKIINKLEDKSVKSISTKEFKTWAEEIFNNVQEKDDELEQLKNNIQTMPDEYGRESSKESSNFLYSILIKHK